jgi:hypothetical protein
MTARPRVAPTRRVGVKVTDQRFKSEAISANWARAALARHAITSRLAVASCEGWLATAEGL